MWYSTCYCLSVICLNVDPRIEALENILPGGQCGGCGFPSCHAYAQNMLENGAAPNRCILGSDIVGEISKILGKEVATVEKKIAVIHCYGGSTAVKKYEYGGISSCRAASLYSGGDTLCTYSCLRFGDCVEVCPLALCRYLAGKSLWLTWKSVQGVGNVPQYAQII